MKAPMQTASSLSIHKFKGVFCLIRKAKLLIILHLPKLFCNRSLGFFSLKAICTDSFLKILDRQCIYRVSIVSLEYRAIVSMQCILEQNFWLVVMKISINY